MIDETLLYDKDIEREVVRMFSNGLNDSYWDRCADLLSEDCFSEQLYRDWYKCAVRVREDRNSLLPPFIFVKAKEIGTRTDPKKFLDIDGTNAYRQTDPTKLVITLRDLLNRRKTAQEFMGLISRFYNRNEAFDLALRDARLFIDKVQSVGGSSVKRMAELGEGIMLDIERAMNGKIDQGMPTLFHYIDNKGGFMDGDLNIVAGATSSGKSSFCLALALNLASQGFPVVFYSLEMPPAQLVNRIYSITSGVPSLAMATRRLSNEEFGKVLEGYQKTFGYPIYFDEKSTSSYMLLERSIRGAVSRIGARVVFVDYVQLVTGTERDKRDRVSNTANSLKALAVELEVCIVLVSQLTRAQKGETPIPRLSDLKESGDIENAADNVYLIYRPEAFSGKSYKYPDMSVEWSRYSTSGTALLIQAKGRNSGLGECLLGFNAQCTHFYERDSFEEAEEIQDPLSYSSEQPEF